MQIKIQILSHKNNLFFLPTPKQVTFNATILALIFQNSVFSLICSRRKIIRSPYNCKVWFFSWTVNVQNSCHLRLKPHPIMAAFFSLILFPTCTNQFQWNKKDLLRIEIRFFMLVYCNIRTLLMTVVLLAPQTTSRESIATHYIISIASNLVTFNLVTTRMSNCLLQPTSLTLQMTSKSLAVTNFMHSQSYHTPSSTPPA